MCWEELSLKIPNYTYLLSVRINGTQLMIEFLLKNKQNKTYI